MSQQSRYLKKNSPNPRNYWKVLKHRLIKEGNETVTNCNQLKMQAEDGKNVLLISLIQSSFFASLMMNNEKMTPEQARQFCDDVLNIVSQLPCHRVVNKEGRLAPGWSRQRPLLESEGVQFRPNGYVEIKKHLWEPEWEL